MKNCLPATKLSESAKRSRFRHVWIVDVLIALLLFMIASAVQSAVLTPVLSVWMVQNVDLIGAATGGDYQSLLESIMQVLNSLPDWFSVLSLVLTVTVIIACLVYATKIERRPAGSLGFRGKSPALEYLFGYGVGLLLFGTAWLLCVVTGTARFEGVSPSCSWVIVLFLVGYLVQGMSEEVLCRGFLLQTLSARYAPFVAVVINSALFMALHFLNPGMSVLAAVNLFLFGAFASVFLWKRGNIWSVAAIHSAWNFMQGNLLGIRVSGNALQPSLFATTLSPSGAWMNGGSFGLEGGLAVTVVLIAAIAVMLFAPVRRDAQLEA